MPHRHNPAKRTPRHPEIRLCKHRLEREIPLRRVAREMGLDYPRWLRGTQSPLSATSTSPAYARPNVPTTELRTFALAFALALSIKYNDTTATTTSPSSLATEHLSCCAAGQKPPRDGGLLNAAASLPVSLRCA